MGDYEVYKIDHANHLLLDQPLLRLPHELLKKNFRSAHFAVEKDAAAVKNLLRESATSAVGGRASADDVLRGLDAMIARCRGTKRKLAAHAAEEARLCRQVDARLAHLAGLARMRALDDAGYEAWSRTRLDRLLVDYLLRQGYVRSAEALADERGMRDLVDVDTFVHMSRVRASLRGGSVAEALQWCTENKKELRKMDSSLEFQLRFQQYIEMVRTQRQDKMLEAIAFAKKHLIPFRDAFPEEVSHAAGLLAFPPAAAQGVFRDMYSPDRWAMLADVFTTTHNSLLALPSSPLLHIALSSGLSALKTPACHSEHHAPSPLQGGGGAPPRDEAAPPGAAAAAPPSLLNASVCPICSTELNELARNVPYAHHSKSHVEHDLLLLPNGRVYSKARLDEYARKTALPEGQVRDPRAGDLFPAAQLKKVYIT